MPNTLVVPLQLTAEGKFATTTDPKRILEQRIKDLLVTHWGERVMRPEHGANVVSFLFSNVDAELMNAKAAEIKGILNSSIGFGQIVEVTMRPLEEGSSTVRVTVYYQVFEGGQIETLTRSFSGFLDEESGI